MTEQTIFRTVHDADNPYVILNKLPLNRDDLSWKAKGIWAYLMSKPDDWTVVIEDLIKRAKDGERSVRSGIKELQAAGYIVSVQERDGDGQFQRKVWHVYESPNTPPPVGVSVLPKRTDGESTALLFSASGKPASGKRRTTNKRDTNTDKPIKEKNNNSIAGGELKAFVYVLAEVTGIDQNLINWGHYGKEAKKLHTAGYTSEQVAGIYQRGGAWYLKDWRGQKGQKPTVKQIRETVKELVGVKEEVGKYDWALNS